MSNVNAVVSARLMPFDESQQKLLTLVDAACQSQAKVLKDEITRRQLAGEQLALDDETTGWMNIITAYGILFNRAIEAGWIESEIIIEK